MNDAFGALAGSLQPAVGGFSGETFVSDIDGEQTVLRLYHETSTRGPSGAEVDAALLHWVRGLIPVADVLEVRRSAGDEPGLLVTSYVSGDLLSETLPEATTPQRERLGQAVGKVLADLAGIATTRPGQFIDEELTIHPWEGSDGLPGYVAQLEPQLQQFWRDHELVALTELATEAQRTLDQTQRTCLVHSDFNPKNLIVAPNFTQVRALLDWEYAHSGHPYTDLGNFLRFERDPALTEAVIAEYVAHRGGSETDALQLGRCADLWALVELSSRANQNPVAQAAHELLQAIAKAQDLHATP